MRFRLFFIGFFLLWSVGSRAQTIGTLVNEEASLNGYVFFSPFSGTKAWLIDNCGQLINSWDRGTQPGLAAYFLETGQMLRTYKPNPNGPFTSASNAGGLELVDWENNTVWSYEINTSDQISHHDAVYMPNGHILVLSWKLVYESELIELGRDPNEIAAEGFMWSENILELEPVGSNQANIVWEWNIKDHYIQDFDPDKLNYGVVAEHPELFNINLPELNSSNSNSSRDWNHFNAIDYNPDLDQILISVRNSDEIWILDHSTTTGEAASHTGGLSGKGGDILYRWGNPAAYDRGLVMDQQFFGQHGVHWIKPGLEDAGKIMIFNNGNGRPGTDFSSGEIIEPPGDGNGGYLVPVSEAFGPLQANIVYGNTTDEFLYSPYLSNAQRLENGNTLLNFGSIGISREVTPNHEVVWEYVTPLNGDFAYTQGQIPSNNSSFRVYKYPTTYPGFAGVDLTPGPTIELGTDPGSCEIYTTQATESLSNSATLGFDMDNQVLMLDNPDEQALEIWLVDIQGRQELLKNRTSAERQWNLYGHSPGIYFVYLLSENGHFQNLKIVVF